MSFVVLALMFAVIAATVGLLVAMYAKDKPYYGAVAMGMLLGPASILAFAYVALA
jgi:hypothetical protein